MVQQLQDVHRAVQTQSLELHWISEVAKIAVPRQGEAYIGIKIGTPMWGPVL